MCKIYLFEKISKEITENAKKYETYEQLPRGYFQFSHEIFYTASTNIYATSMDPLPHLIVYKATPGSSSHFDPQLVEALPSPKFVPRIATSESPLYKERF